MKKDDIEIKIDRIADKIDEKFDKAQDRLTAIEIATVQNTASLDLHMKRTELAEQRLELLETEIKPILQGMNFLKILAKIGTFISSVLYGISQFFR